VTIVEPAPVSPECAVLRHAACTGDAWSDRLDVLVVCTCACHDVQEEPWP
jgi:hypothetical protein